MKVISGRGRALMQKLGWLSALGDRLASEPGASCLCLLSAKITSLCHYVQASHPTAHLECVWCQMLWKRSPTEQEAPPALVSTPNCVYVNTASFLSIIFPLFSCPLQAVPPRPVGKRMDPATPSRQGDLRVRRHMRMMG